VQGANLEKCEKGEDVAKATFAVSVAIRKMDLVGCTVLAAFSIRTLLRLDALPEGAAA
jgi:hypothetical protein